MTIIAFRPNPAPPPDATEVFGWEHIFSDHELHRFFCGFRDRSAPATMQSEAMRRSGAND